MAGKRPTPAQDAARMRNWRIRSLRALQEMARSLDRDLWQEAVAVIDRQLARMGADTREVHFQKVAGRCKPGDSNTAAEREAELPF